MTLSDSQFLRLGMEDIDALVALEAQCFSAPWSHKQFRLGLEGQVFKVFGIKDAKDLTAYISFYHVADEMEVLNLAVAPGLRRQGLGARLLGLVLQICVKMGIKNAHLEVRVGNTAARALYEKYGFQQVGLRPGYYPDTGEDAVLMALDLERTGGRPFVHASQESSQGELQ